MQKRMCQDANTNRNTFFILFKSLIFHVFLFHYWMFTIHQAVRYVMTHPYMAGRRLTKQRRGRTSVSTNHRADLPGVSRCDWARRGPICICIDMPDGGGGASEKCSPSVLIRTEKAGLTECARRRPLRGLMWVNCTFICVCVRVWLCEVARASRAGQRAVIKAPVCFRSKVFGGTARAFRRPGGVCARGVSCCYPHIVSRRWHRQCARSRRA